MEHTISNIDQILIEDNIFYFIKPGYGTSNIFPLNCISVSEVFRDDQGRNGYRFYIKINDSFLIVTDKHLEGSDGLTEARRLMYSVYIKLKEALIETHRNKFNINKPKTPKL